MPELPEVETMVRGVRQSMTGAKIVQFKACPCACRPMAIAPDFEVFSQAVAGQTVTEVWRKAKRVVIDLANDHHIVFEPRMTGLLLLADPPDVEHLRFEFRMTLNRKQRSIYLWDRRGLGTVKLYSTVEFRQLLGPDRLGPDALEVSPEELTLQLRSTQRPIKIALLDQRLVAGVGNLYASEILHEAGIHPATPSSRLSSARVRRIHAAMQRILLEAIEYEGSTLNDGTYRNALNKDGGYQNKHRVYAKADSLCPTCGKSNIQRTVQAQRSTFFCPRCQR